MKKYKKHFINVMSTKHFSRITFIRNSQFQHYLKVKDVSERKQLQSYMTKEYLKIIAECIYGQLSGLKAYFISDF